MSQTNRRERPLEPKVTPEEDLPDFELEEEPEQVQPRLLDTTKLDPKLNNQNIRIFKHQLDLPVALPSLAKSTVETTDSFGGSAVKTIYDISTIPRGHPIALLSQQLAAELKAALPDYRVTMMTRKAEIWGKPESIQYITWNMSFSHSRKQVYIYFILA